VKAQYRELWSRGLEGPLNYYRASPLRPATKPDDPINTLVFPPEFVTVNVPTTVLWGEADIALPTALLDGLAAYVPQINIHRVPGASHWLTHEQPALVIRTVERLVA
jgi:epoxide hydrolase 4